MVNLSEYIIEGFLDNKLLKPLRDFIQRNFKKKVGFKEMIEISIQGDKYQFTATIDTGNGGVVPTLGVDKMNINGDKVTILIGDKEYTFDKKGEASPTVGNVVHHRPIIIIDYIKISGRKLDEPFIAVTDKRNKSTKSLINRDVMSKLNLIVDPQKNSLIHEKLHLNKDIEPTSSFEQLHDAVFNYFNNVLKINKNQYEITFEDLDGKVTNNIDELKRIRIWSRNTFFTSNIDDVAKAIKGEINKIKKVSRADIFVTIIYIYFN